MTISALQLATLPLSQSRIDYYIKLASDRGSRIVLLGEYNLNSFFWELKALPKSMIREQTERQSALMGELSAKHGVTIVAPIIREDARGWLKGIGKFDGAKCDFWAQNFLISYDHWDENAFFANRLARTPIAAPIFEIDGFRFSALCGFDMHFDACFDALIGAGVDCILCPSACTLGSNERWEMLLRMRAFTQNAYVLRANRVGSSAFEGRTYDFYGESLLISPSGKIIQSLNDKEGILACEISREEISEAKNLWKFGQIYRDKQTNLGEISEQISNASGQNLGEISSIFAPAPDADK